MGTVKYDEAAKAGVQTESDPLSISAVELAAWLKDETPPALIDVRSEREHKALYIPGARLATRDLVEEIFSKWSKDAAIVVYDHLGKAGLDAARALAGQGFTRAKALQGGIDAWSQEVDPLIPRY